MPEYSLAEQDPQSGLFRYTRNRFSTAGQNSFDTPPTQDPDAFELMQNTLPVVTDHLERRWGLNPLLTNPSANALRLAEFRISTGLIRGIVSTDNTKAVLYNEADFSTLVDPLFNYANPAQPPRFLTSRSYLYSGNGSDMLKSNGVAGSAVQQNWGIVAPGIETAPFGPNNPGAVASVPVHNGWTNPGALITGAPFVDGNLQELAGWATLVGGDVGGVPPTSYGFTQFQPPSGTAMQLSTNGPASANWRAYITGGRPIFAQNIGLLNMSFTLNTDVNTPGVAQAIEFDTRVSVDGWNYNFSARLNYAAGGTLQISDGSQPANWVDTGFVPGVLTPGTTYQILCEYKFDTTAKKYSIIAVTIGATRYVIPSNLQNLTPLNLSWADGAYPQLQQNINGSGGAYSMLVDNMEYLWPRVAGSQYATYTLQNGQTIGPDLEPGFYGFNVSSDINVSGVQVDVYGYSTGNAEGILQVSLNKATGGTSEIKLANLATDPATHIVLGGPKDLWGTQWSSADFSDGDPSKFVMSGFYVNGIPLAPGPAGTYVPDINFFISAIQVTIYYPGSFSFTLAAGNIALLNGRRYGLVFQNGANNGTSDLSAMTPSTGALTSKEVVLNGLPVSPDPQVTGKVLLATADGGDISTLYQVAILPNSTTTYTDDTSEDALLLANIWQETDDQGIEHGVSGNTPPPATNLFCKHKGRVYFLQGSTLWFSKSNDEMLTSTGLLCGRYEESVPGDYQMDISDEAEIGSCLFSDGTILYIATEKQIRRLYGDGPTNFAKPETHFTEVGVLCPELLSTISVDGRPAGVCWVTPDLKVIGSDFLFYQNIGTPVQDILDNINADVIRSVGWSTFIAKGPFQFYVLAVPTGSNTAIDTLLIYDFTRKKWHTWVLPDGLVVQSLLRNITVNGTPRLLLGGHYLVKSGGTQRQVPYIWELSPDLSQDQVTATLTLPITAKIRTTWQYFEDQNLRKDFDEIEIFTKDPNMTLTLEAASNIDEFDNPVPVVSNMTLRKSAFGEYKWYLAGYPTVDRYYRFTFTSSLADRAFTDGYRMDIIPEHRF